MDIKNFFVLTWKPIFSKIYSSNKETTTKRAKATFSIHFCVQNRKFNGKNFYILKNEASFSHVILFDQKKASIALAVTMLVLYYSAWERGTQLYNNYIELKLCFQVWV